MAEPAMRMIEEMKDTIMLSCHACIICITIITGSENNKE